MGGLCTGGTMKHHQRSNNSSYSFDNNSKNGSNMNKKKKKKNYDGVEEDESYDEMNSASSDSFSNNSGFEFHEKKRTPHIFDSGELNFNISTQFLNRRSAAARMPPATKVLFKSIVNDCGCIFWYDFVLYIFSLGYLDNSKKWK